jgi:EAL domain-containing protein (putative c-di-GMP-specific phosphodiesterase class I)
MRPDAPGDEAIERLLRVVCEQLGLESAFIGRIESGRRTVCHVASPTLLAGHSDPADETYCQLIVDGEVDRVIPDVQAVPRLAGLAVTEALGIGSYIGLPLILADGTLYGTLCAFGPEANPRLSTEDVRLLDLVAAVVADRLEDDVRRERERHAARHVIVELLAGDQPAMVFQPIVDIGTSTPVGFEALARFDTDPHRSPDRWFDAAIEVGLGVDLELQAVRHALAGAAQLPSGCYLTINASPELLVSGRLHALLGDASDLGRRVVVEVTEHERADATDFAPALVELRQAGYRIAMDDVGSGHSGLTRLIALQPDIVKLDRGIITGIDANAARKALVAAAVGFGSVAGGRILAEGIETDAEARTLEALGVRFGQGYHFGRPAQASTWQRS